MPEKTKEEIAIIEVTEEYLQGKLYDIRGYKVMLDTDLAAMTNSFVNNDDNEFIKNQINKKGAFKHEKKH